MIEFTDEQKKAISIAQEKFKSIKDNPDLLTDSQLDLLFGQARSMNGWKEKEISDQMLQSL